MAKKVGIIGGGAAGFFTAINLAELHPEYEIFLFEKQNKFLSKVKVSGGGRCNVTHAEFVPSEFTKFYPRGRKELNGPLHSFCSGDMMEWLEKRGVELKIEEDGRIFPASNSSQTIIDCFLNEARKLGVKIQKNAAVTFDSFQDNSFKVSVSGEEYQFDSLVVATGSTPQMWKALGKLGLKTIVPVPSLFSFHISDKWVTELAGLSVGNIEIHIPSLKEKSAGPVLCTHKGLSGPAVLKLSAWSARELNQMNYDFDIEINWITEHEETFKQWLIEQKEIQPNKQLGNTRFYDLPKRLSSKLIDVSNVPTNKQWASLNKKEIHSLTTQFTKCLLHVKGKSPNKEEFVTAGGIDLKTINFKTFESKEIAGLHFAGEVLNIDALTGGFNFQAAWTGSWIVAHSI